MSDASSAAQDDTPHRRKADRPAIRGLGWVACLVLAGSLIYVFVRTLLSDERQVDPLFLSLQSVASALFLAYSIRIGNKIFIAANAVALASAVGSVLLVVFG